MSDYHVPYTGGLDVMAPIQTGIRGERLYAIYSLKIKQGQGHKSVYLRFL